MPVLKSLVKTLIGEEFLLHKSKLLLLDLVNLDLRIHIFEFYAGLYEIHHLE